MSFHPLGYTVKEQYPGQHPAESVLDHIMHTLISQQEPTKEGKLEAIRHIAQHYFDHKATLPKTPVYDMALAGPALNEIRKTAHELVCGLLPKDGWVISLEKAQDLACTIDREAQYLWPDIK